MKLLIIYLYVLIICILTILFVIYLKSIYFKKLKIYIIKFINNDFDIII